MSSERFRTIERVFNEACALVPKERAAYLDRACAGDADLRASVEAMLIQDSEASSPINPDQPGGGVANIFQAAAEAAWKTEIEHDIDIPERIGNYRVMRCLGEGGMGIVFEAEQEHPRRRVALKLIRNVMARRQILRRFEMEAQVLGSLQHPGIAQVFEAGSTTIGGANRPFLAMEFVNGLPITEYVRKQGLDTGAILELFCKLCDAVQYAHQKGVIHRDLKPPNILVTESRQPKVLDFGVARVTDADIQITTQQTDVGQLIGTLQYMSPEQANADASQLDTRSDVYALGVLLYELLTGQQPYDLQGRSIVEAVSIIQYREPTNLSTIRRAYRGDIETIVLKAMEKDRDRRYQSAQEFGADIRRFLQNKSIAARPATAWYQFHRFAKRNPYLVGASVLFLLTLLTALVVMSSLYIRADRAQTHARNEAERAGREAARAEAINNFLLQDLLASPSPERDGYDVRVMEVLDRASANVEKRFEDQPRLAVEIYRAIGSIYDRLGIPREGLKDFRRAVEISNAAFSQDDPELLAAKLQLASALIRLDQVEEPESLIRDALAHADIGTGDENKLTQALLSNLGELLQKTRRFHEAEPILRRVTETARRVHGPGDEQSLHAASSLVACLMAQGKIDEAGPVLADALSAARASHGETHQATLGMMNNYAALLIRLGRFSEAEAVYRDLLKAVRRALPPGSFNLGMTLGSLGICLAMQDRHDEAIDPLMEAVEILTATAGGEHHMTERVLSELYQALYDSNRRGEALVYHQDAVKARLRIAGPGETESVVRSITEWSIELEDHGVHAPIDHAIHKLLDEASAMAAQAHPRTARYLENLGWALVRTGHPACGEIILNRARDMLEESQHADRQRLTERIAEAGVSQANDTGTNGLARVSVTTGNCARWLDGK